MVVQVRRGIGDRRERRTGGWTAQSADEARGRGKELLRARLRLDEFIIISVTIICPSRRWSSSSSSSSSFPLENFKSSLNLDKLHITLKSEKLSTFKLSSKITRFFYTRYIYYVVLVSLTIRLRPLIHYSSRLMSREWRGETKTSSRPPSDLLSR